MPRTAGPLPGTASIRARGRGGRASWVLMLLITLALGAACGPSEAERTAAAEARAKAAAEETAKAEARRAAVEAERLRALWSYPDEAAGKGRQIAAFIKSSNDVDTGGDAPHSVLFVFRDHPAWGRSSYLVLDTGDFACAPRCRVTVAVDDSAPVPFAAHKPNTREAIALFIDDWRALWRTTTHAQRLAITFPVKAGGTRTATYDVGGLDASKMPGWGTERP